jgi:pilus assembly protein CpaB
MKVRPVIVLALALFLALAAVYFARIWLSNQSGTSAAGNQAPVVKVVAAATALKFGDRLAVENLKLIDWPAGSVPDGTFKSVDELLGPQPRVALQAIQPNELILGSKVTGPGQRASLSAVISTGMRAMTIRVNDVLGVAGFVLPGDRVDIMLTREIVQNDPITNVLLQNVKVLGIDQKSDQQAHDPDVVKAVTIEVTTEQAQKITLAATVGKLSLALRDVSNVELATVKPVSIRDLGVSEAIGTVDPKPEDKKVEKPVVKIVPKPKSDQPSIGITRGTSRQEYKVNAEGAVVQPNSSAEPPKKAPEEVPVTPPPVQTPAPTSAPAAAATSS